MTSLLPEEAGAAAHLEWPGLEQHVSFSWAGVLPSNEGNSDLDWIISKDSACCEILFSWEVIQKISDNHMQTAELLRARFES